MLISIASQIVTSLADILFRDKTTPFGLPVEPEVNVIMAAPSSNGRFGGKASEIFIGEGTLRVSRLSGDKTNLAFDADSKVCTRIQVGFAMEWHRNSASFNHCYDSGDVLGPPSDWDKHRLI